MNDKLYGGTNMIKHLAGDFETVEYPENHFIILYDNSENEDYPLHWHNAVEIIMPLINDFTVFAGEKTYRLRERDIIIIPSGDLHSMTAPEKGQRIIFQCDNSVLNGFPALSSISDIFSKVIFINQNSSENIKGTAKKTMLEIYDEYFRRSELSEIKIYMKLISMFVTIYEEGLSELRGQLGCTAEKLGEYSERFGAVLKYIEKNYTDDITLDKLSDIAGYSKYHFSRIFRQYIGMSHIDYVNKIRTNAAQKLLLCPDLSITEVAMNSGFSSIASFNRVFKEIKHCTPSEFKKFYQNR